MDEVMPHLMRPGVAVHTQHRMQVEVHFKGPNAPTADLLRQLGPLLSELPQLAGAQGRPVLLDGLCHLLYCLCCRAGFMHCTSKQAGEGGRLPLLLCWLVLQAEAAI